MAEDQAPDPADQPDEGESKPEPYRLGGSGNAGGSTPGAGGGQPTNPFEALFSSLGGGQGHRAQDRRLARR